MKSREFDSFPIHFLCTRTVKTQVSFSPPTHRVAPVLSWKVCSVWLRVFQRRSLITGAGDQTGTKLNSALVEKETMTITLQYLNIYYLSSHSVGRSTYSTPRQALHLYVGHRGEKRWVRRTGRGRVSNGRRVLSEELSWALSKAWF